MPQAEGEAARAPRRAGLGASPSVAARQLPLGGSIFRSQYRPLRGRCRRQRGRPRAPHDERGWEPPPQSLRDSSPSGEHFPIPISPPEGEMPQAEGEAARAARRAGLGASPSVAARQLPLGGSIFRSQYRPPRGRCRRQRGRPHAPHDERCWEPPPQSLRDSSPAGGAFRRELNQAGGAFAAGAGVVVGFEHLELIAGDQVLASEEARGDAALLDQTAQTLRVNL